MAYTVIVEKRALPVDGWSQWERVRAFENFYSEPDVFLLNVAKAVGDQEWIKTEEKRRAGCAMGGRPQYRVFSGNSASRCWCLECDGKAVGIAGGVWRQVIRY